VTAPRVLLNVFHPNLASSRANRLIVDELRQLPGATVRDVQKTCPDWKIDVAREQELLLAHDLIVFQHPFYWYSCPALMKLWMDEVLTQGFAYPPGVGDSLRGKAWLSSITTGGPWEAYRSGGFNNWTISELLRPFQQSALLAGMTWLPPFVMHSVLPPGIAGFRNVTDDEIAAHGRAIRDYLAGYGT
jgi:glutathione-regulated potassium-efflux system ancillary protein KefG